jgi:hypothetical protein
MRLDRRAKAQVAVALRGKDLHSSTGLAAERARQHASTNDDSAESTTRPSI